MKKDIKDRTHWKEILDYEYLGAYSLEGRGEIILTIKSVAKESVKNADGKEDTCLVLYFAEEQKGMICNATNAKRIEAVYKTGIVADWVGKKVQLYTEEVSAWGKKVPALRIREFAPKNDKAQRIDKLNAEIRAALANAPANVAEPIRAELAVKYKAGMLDEAALKAALGTLLKAETAQSVEYLEGMAERLENPNQ